MNLFQSINSEAQKRAVRFLVIGGLATNCYGYSRDTVDLDLLVQKERRQDWLDLFSTLGYNLLADGGVFVQFSPPKAGAWPVDLMLVREPTFAPMLEQSKEVELFATQMRIPALEHLLALKLHALKHTHVGRFLKDFLDVENLVRVNRIDLRSERVRQLFLKYGNLDLYEKALRACDRE
ncbi:MAG TPA: hypothetical protein PKA41_18475 [Verrucomicrobiota bacterium]|nr:hypothetical protein [Verrucomicrobiota bacterium]